MTLGFSLKSQMFNTLMIFDWRCVRQLHLGLFSHFNCPVLFDMLVFWETQIRVLVTIRLFQARLLSVPTVAFNSLPSDRHPMNLHLMKYIFLTFQFISDLSQGWEKQ